jgi:hypothetical protein
MKALLFLEVRSDTGSLVAHKSVFADSLEAACAAALKGYPDNYSADYAKSGVVLMTVEGDGAESGILVGDVLGSDGKEYYLKIAPKE